MVEVILGNSSFTGPNFQEGLIRKTLVSFLLLNEWHSRFPNIFQELSSFIPNHCPMILESLLGQVFCFRLRGQKIFSGHGIIKRDLFAANSLTFLSISYM